jgi:biopolymer transport protein ExbD
MAEIQEKDSGKGGKVRSKKNSGKPDMTPMVDLGFLLITFFMFTTTFSKPNMMKLNMPEKNDEDKPETSEIKLSNTITIVMGKDDRIFWHQKTMDELTPEFLNESDYSETGIRMDIMKRRAAAIDTSKFTIVIKPSDLATFKNTVDILDEMEITGNRLFALVDLTPVEKTVLEEKTKTPKKSN